MSGASGRAATERHIVVDRTARYWTIGGLPEKGGDLWLVLHGYKQLARRFLRRFEAIATERRMIVAPEALSRFYVSPEPGRHGPSSLVGATWMTREDRQNEIADYVGYLDRLAVRLGAAEHRLTLLGFSQGVATATRWAVLGSTRLERLLLWGDVIPPDLDLERAAEALRGVDVRIVRGDDDGSVTPELAADEARRLASARVEHTTVRYAGGHDIDETTLRRLASG